MTSNPLLLYVAITFEGEAAEVQNDMLNKILYCNYIDHSAYNSILPNILWFQFFHRLSDFLFVAARYATAKEGNEERIYHRVNNVNDSVSVENPTYTDKS